MGPDAYLYAYPVVTVDNSIAVDEKSIYAVTSKRMLKVVWTGNFWSATAYDALTASGLDNRQPFPALSSIDKPVTNADGSTDIYVGPTAPKGHEKGWLRTVPGKGYFVILRLYSPTQPYFDQTWKLGDIELLK